MALLLWMRTLVPLGEDFTLALQSPCGQDAVRAREIFDLPSAHNFHLVYGEAPILAGRVQPAHSVDFTIFNEEIREETASPEGDCYRHELSGLPPGSYRIVADAGWAARRQLWLIYRAEPPAASLTPLLQRSLHIRLAPAAAELSYVILPREGVTLDQWRADPTLGQFMGDRLAATVLLYWSFYSDSQDSAPSGCEAQSRCFSGREFASLQVSEAIFDEGSLRIVISATLHEPDDLLPLLQVSRDLQNPISIEVEAGNLKLQEVSPPPDVKSGSSWIWRRGPVQFEIAEAGTQQTEERPGAVGLAQIRSWLDAGGQVSTVLVILLLPAAPFAWWAVLSRNDQGPTAPAWPWLLGGLLWLTPLVFLILFYLIDPGVESGMVVMAGAALSVAAYSLTASTARLSRRLWLALSLVVAVPAISAFTLAAALALRESIAVALLTSILILAAFRLGVNAYWPDFKAPRGGSLLLWLAMLAVAIPVQVLGLGFLEGLGWPAQLWPQSIILIGLYVLPYVVLLAALRVLREQSAQLSQNPARLISIGRLVFALYVVGALRGFNPGLQAPPPVYPLAFAIALLVFPHLLSGRAERLQAIGAERTDIYPKQGEFIQRALDLQWARKALSKLMQSESPDPKGYEDRKAELLLYIQQLQSGPVSPGEGSKKGKSKKQGANEHEPPAASVFNFGPHFDPWRNGVQGAGWAAVLAVWLLLVYLPVIAARAEQQVIPFILFTAVFVDVLPLLLKWVLLGFFLGYFFPYLRGANGLQKGLALAAAIAVCTVPHDLLNGASLDSLGAMGLDFAQNALLLTLLGLWAFDYQVLRKHGHNFSRLLIAHNLTFLAGYGTSVVLAIGSALTGLISGRIGPLLEALLNLITPGGQPLS
jgi:hypothetical protein